MGGGNHVERDVVLTGERIARLSVLQELTVAALDLSDPTDSGAAFLDRVAERLGCTVALWLERDASGQVRLASAAGLSRASRQLPLPRLERAPLDERVVELLPYSELARGGLVSWFFPLAQLSPAVDDGTAALLLFFDGEPGRARQHRGMTQRLVSGILGKVLLQRQLVCRLLESERTLHREKTLLECQAEASVEGILVVSDAGVVLSVNRRFAEIWGIPPELRAGTQDAPVELAASRVVEPELFLSDVQRVIGSAEASLCDELVLADGRVLHRYSAPISSADGVRYGRGVYYRDITEQRRAEAERRVLLDRETAARRRAEEQERRARFLAEVSTMLAASLDYEAGLQRMARLVVPWLADWCIVDVVDPMDSFRRIATVHVDARGETAALDSQPDLCARHGPGRVLHTGEPELIPHLSLTGTDEQTAGGGELASELAGCLGARSYISVPMVARDRILGAITLALTERAERYETADLEFAADLARRAAIAVDNALLYHDARKAIAQRDEFMLVASHELKTPVTSLLLAVQSTLRSRHGAARAGTCAIPLRSLEIIDRQSRRLSKLIDGLLDVSRMRAGRLTLELENVDLASVVRDVAGRHAEELRNAGSSIDLRDAESVTGRWDRSRLDQVVTNLLSNAIKYGQGKPIDVSTTEEGEYARLVVRDRGIGIPADQQSRIFQRFARAVPVRSYGGLGLGLHIVREIVTLLGGTIGVESAPGRGATFTVLLPRHRAPLHEATPAAHAPG